MMLSVNDRVIVRVDLAQKDGIVIGGIKVLLGQKYQTNFREKSPVVAEVAEGNEQLRKGDFILCHHNHFYGTSPYHLFGELYSIPANHTIFAVLSPSGELRPVYGNLLACRVEIETSFPVPAEYRECHHDRGLILDGGWTSFRQGDLVFTRPYSLYEIVYIWGDEERRSWKINSEMICAVVRK